jgi:RNA polymerase sigma-70 factor (ECF subfamily)
LVQGFFLKILSNNAFAFASAAPERGRMRTFLLTLFTRHMADEWDRTMAQKRGGGTELLSLDFEDGEQRFTQEPRSEGEIEQAYDRAWAESVIEQTASLLQEECEQSGKGELFHHLVSHIVGEAEGNYEALATVTGLTTANLRQIVHRLRDRFRRLLRQTIADTLTEASEEVIDSELHSLRQALSA